jgi:hypothetical protein
MHELGGMAQRAAITLPIPEQWYGRPLGTVEMLFEEWLKTEDARKDMPGALPFTKMVAEELTWLKGQPHVTAAAGYRLANGDMAIPFYVQPFPSYDAMQDAKDAIDKAAKAWYPKNSTHVALWMEGDFGYVIVTSSQKHRSWLDLFLNNARWGSGPD